MGLGRERGGIRSVSIEQVNQPYMHVYVSVYCQALIEVQNQFELTESASVSVHVWERERTDKSN